VQTIVIAGKLIMVCHAMWYIASSSFLGCQSGGLCCFNVVLGKQGVEFFNFLLLTKGWQMDNVHTHLLLSC
jgi:hypothetical protein